MFFSVVYVMSSLNTGPLAIHTHTQAVTGRINPKEYYGGKAMGYQKQSLIHLQPALGNLAGSIDSL